MKVEYNEDGTVTVSVPQAPETYDEVEGQLYVSETLPAKDFEKATTKPAKKGSKG